MFGTKKAFNEMLRNIFVSEKMTIASAITTKFPFLDGLKDKGLLSEDELNVCIYLNYHNLIMHLLYECLKCHGIQFFSPGT
uniref:HSR domain-containing protein n=1 Tax=Leptobrachium leishanense TaxID=445787 RepID=A0A8C5LV69_9ANUR